MAGERMSPRNRAFLGRRKERPGPHRALVGSAKPIKLDDKTEARRLRVLRQGWQEDALSYVDAIPELSFAYRFQTHAASRMRWFPAITNPEDPGGPPVALDEVSTSVVPDEIRNVCQDALDALGTGGRSAVRPLQESLRYNLGIPGECFIVGTEDPDTGKSEWTIRSIDEFLVYEDTYKLREVPLDPQGILGWIDIDPSTTYACRVWNPHYRFQKLATSPMRALLDVAEELLLLSRDVRATARSRLAGAGILKVPEGLRMMAGLEDNQDAISDEWFGRFAELMMTPIADEGVASAVVPIAVSGEATALAGLEHLLLDRPFSAMAMELRAEAIGRIGTGLDVPREVLEGMSDPNHWGAWLVSDDTFRHHLEPQTITDVDCFSAGYLRPWLQVAFQDARLTPQESKYWLDRLCIWYDPVELITKPDPAENAMKGHDRLVLSNKALCEALGFDPEKDMPDALEMEIRMITKLRSFPPNVLEALIHALDPNLEIPPIQQSGQVPGMGPKGPVQPVAPLPPGGATAEPNPHGPPVPTGGPPSAATPPAAPVGTPALPAGPGMSTGVETESFAATRSGPSAEQVRLSRKLSEIDRDVRTRLHQASCAAVLRLLDRAGAKLRTRVADRRFAKATPEGTRDRIKPVENRKLAAELGEPLVAALGFSDPHALLNPDWSELEGQFNAWVRQAQLMAVRTACQLAKVPPEGPIARAAEARMAAALPTAWGQLRDELDHITESLLYNPDPNASDELNLNPNTVVPVGVVRRALSVAGGTQPKGIVASDDPGGAVSVDERYPSGTDEDQSNVEGVTSGEGHVLQDVPDDQPSSGQIGGGDAIGDLMDSANMTANSYVWSHGPSLRPFEPHEDLDGTEFASFDDDALANAGDWPDNDFFFPGDHDGCSCDFMTIWGDGEPGDDTGATDDGSATADLTDDGTGAGDTSTDGGDPFAGLDLSDWAQAVADLTGDAGPDSQAAAWRDLDAAKQSVMDDVMQAKADAESVLDQMGTQALARPATDDTSAEYDWYRQLSSQERDRLRNNDWVTSDAITRPDQAAQGLFANADAASVDQAMQTWLDATRTIDAARLVEGGRALSANVGERFGGFNFDNLAPNSPYSVRTLFGERHAAADYVASTRSSGAAEMVERTLTGSYGSPIYTMRYDDYAAEVTRLYETVTDARPITEDAEFGTVYSPEVQAAFNRLDELLPEELAPLDTEPDLLNVWSQAVQIARLAGLGES